MAEESSIRAPLRIVRLDALVSAAPTFSIPHVYTEHHNTAYNNNDLISERLKDADVAITTRVPITASTLIACPSIKLIAVFAIGSDHVDLAACAKHGVTVVNVPAASNEAVAEHAISLYFALRRRVVQMHDLTVGGERWAKEGSLTKVFGGLPPTAREEVLGVVGGGELGNRVANIGRALGMKVLFAERKGASEIREGKTSFVEVLSQATVLMLTLPLTSSTLSLISTAELALLQRNALIINIARGGIVDEEALVVALRENRVAGAATDVFVVEPAGKENVLIKAAGEEWATGRLVLSPHIAWLATSSIEKLRRTTTENIEAWWRGEIINAVIA